MICVVSCKTVQWKPLKGDILVEYVCALIKIAKVTNYCKKYLNFHVHCFTDYYILQIPLLNVFSCVTCSYGRVLVLEKYENRWVANI